MQTAIARPRISGMLREEVVPAKARLSFALSGSTRNRKKKHSPAQPPFKASPLVPPRRVRHFFRSASRTSKPPAAHPDRSSPTQHGAPHPRPRGDCHRARARARPGRGRRVGGQQEVDEVRRLCLSRPRTRTPACVVGEQSSRRDACSRCEREKNTHSLFALLPPSRPPRSE